MKHMRAVRHGKPSAPNNGISLGTVLIGLVLVAVLATSLISGAVGIFTIINDVSKDKQERVNHDLTAVRSQFDYMQQRLADRFFSEISVSSNEIADNPARIEDLQTQLGFTILNLCNAEGKPLSGSYQTGAYAVPVESDPLLRSALSGEASSGSMWLSGERLEQEGGAALRSSLEQNMLDKESGALFWWYAYPIRDRNGSVQAIVYGGKSLNRNFTLVDDLRELVFGRRSYNGKPFGTVTVFLNDTRVATNVVTSNGSRAVGTIVSDEVREKVLGRGEKWLDRALVVDTWYVAAYEPLRDPDNNTIGMLYVGLLEAPYTDLVAGLITKLLLVVVSVSLVTGVISIFIVRRITMPLKQLSLAVQDFAGGERHKRLDEIHSYSEINRFALAFRQMQEAIAGHELELSRQNDQLKEVNDKLGRTNRNYMETLGFVTHELKSPLAAIQTMISTVELVAADEIPEQAQQFLSRIKRRSEELQDMVKNYLDLSRVERGELQPTFEVIDFVSTVIEPCVQQIMPMFESRKMKLDVQTPEQLDITADQELLRITLNNFLSNAAKYGKEGGKAKLTVNDSGGEIIASVWNEGEGFSEEEGRSLFGKFTRLKNANTRKQNGSGLGLFLCKDIAQHHGGNVSAESKLGHWAQFQITIPLKQAVRSEKDI